ncbi:hypothetical protein BDV18DRAFT_53238 [Aspergillus unguis]
MVGYSDLSADDILSDDSSFYGDSQETATLEQTASEYDAELETYWSTIHPTLLSTIQSRLQEEKKQALAKDSNSSKVSSLPTNMDMDIEPAGSLTTFTESALPRNKPGPNETPASFLARLPPSTTKESDIGPWIYIHTPNIARLQDDVAEFTKLGREALETFQAQEASLRYENDQKGGTKIALARKVKPLQRELEEKITKLARDTNCVTGKWMMFVTADRIDGYWKAVAEATMNGHLGIAAKVATDGGSDADAGTGHGNWQNRARLLAVYTRDYEDHADVKRVLRKLVELNLVKKGERPIYYKRDALTYLEIMSKNRYGMRATAFSSADVLDGKI